MTKNKNPARVAVMTLSPDAPGAVAQRKWLDFVSEASAAKRQAQKTGGTFELYFTPPTPNSTVRGDLKRHA